MRSRVDSQHPYKCQVDMAATHTRHIDPCRDKAPQQASQSNLTTKQVLCSRLTLSPIYKVENNGGSRQWWHNPLILALRRQRQLDLCELKASQVYRANSWSSQAPKLQENPVSKKYKRKKKMMEEDSLLNFRSVNAQTHMCSKTCEYILTYTT